MISTSHRRRDAVYACLQQTSGDNIGARLAPVFRMGLRMGAVLLTACCSALAADGDEQRRSQVEQLLRAKCVTCHGDKKAESALRLDSRLGALRGGDSGEAVVVPGDSANSHLMERVISRDSADRMPPEGAPLSPAEVKLLRAWIDATDTWSAAVAELDSDQLDHWSFQPLVRPRLPAGAGRHPIDRFVQAKLRSVELTMSPEASRRKLVRRLHLVMHGIPPSAAQVERFAKDTSPGAWERLTSGVLSSPRYGERWATYWLDLIRFGETHGFETNRERPNAWRYRDWVIASLNGDVPFDQFVVRQLAGDATGHDVATGFLVAGPYDLVKGQDPLLRLTQRQDELAGMINTTGTAFLGLTLGCARCHNHKFDPISQTDYYALQAVFAGVQHEDRALQASGEVTRQIAELDRRAETLRRELVPYRAMPVASRPPVNAERNEERFDSARAKFVRFTVRATNRSQPCIDELEIFSGDRNVGLASGGATATSSGDFVHPLHKLEHINDGRYGNARSWIAAKPVDGWVQIELPQVTSVNRIVWGRDRQGKYKDRLATEYQITASMDGEVWRVLASSDDRAPFREKSDSSQPKYDLTGLSPRELARAQRQLTALKAVEMRRADLTRPVLAYAGTFRQPGPTRRLYRGDPQTPREEVAPGAIASLGDLRLGAAAPEQERRVALARWISDRSNPLTARVIVNRVWQHHFGTGLVATPSDFGANGARPSHPQLLDWLASELIDHEWSVKHIQRLILTSATWRQDSRPRRDAEQRDAEVRLLWRFPPRRLNAEAIRDSMLFTSGALDRRMGGPGFSGFKVERENVRHYFPKTQFGPDDWRRMVYMTKVRQERESVFGVFDCPDSSQVTPVRSRSTTPLQALNLLNSQFVNQQSSLLADRLGVEADTPAGRVRRAYQLCFSRPPTDEEIASAVQFVTDTDWRQFARAMFNSSEFIFIP